MQHIPPGAAIHQWIGQWRSQVTSRPEARRQLQRLLGAIDAAKRRVLRVRRHLAVIQRWLAGRPERPRGNNLNESYRSTREALLERHQAFAPGLGPIPGAAEQELWENLCQPTSLEEVFRACEGRPLEIRRRLARALDVVEQWEGYLRHFRKAILEELEAEGEEAT